MKSTGISSVPFREETDDQKGVVAKNLNPPGFRSRVWICSFINNSLRYLIGGLFLLLWILREAMRPYYYLKQKQKVPKLFPPCAAVQIKTKTTF